MHHPKRFAFSNINIPCPRIHCKGEYYVSQESDYSALHNDAHPIVIAGGMRCRQSQFSTIRWRADNPDHDLARTR